MVQLAGAGLRVRSDRISAAPASARPASCCRSTRSRTSP